MASELDVGCWMYAALNYATLGLAHPAMHFPQRFEQRLPIVFGRFQAAAEAQHATRFVRRVTQRGDNV